jgi:hypothetical protein
LSSISAFAHKCLIVPGSFLVCFPGRQTSTHLLSFLCDTLYFRFLMPPCWSTRVVFRSSLELLDSSSLLLMPSRAEFESVAYVLHISPDTTLTWGPFAGAEVPGGWLIMLKPSSTFDSFEFRSLLSWNWDPDTKDCQSDNEMS